MEIIVDMKDEKKKLDYELAELWTKMKTIRDDKNTPTVYSHWCDQVMDMLGMFKNV